MTNFENLRLNYCLFEMGKNKTHYVGYIVSVVILLPIDFQPQIGLRKARLRIRMAKIITAHS